MSAVSVVMYTLDPSDTEAHLELERRINEFERFNIYTCDQDDESRRVAVIECEEPAQAKTIAQELGMHGISSDRDVVTSASGHLLSERTPKPFVPEHASHMMPILYAAPPGDDVELDHWYEDEHTAILFSVPAWLRVRRFAIDWSTSGSWSRLLLHDLADGDVLDLPEIRAGMNTPWRNRFATTDWFLQQPRLVYARRDYQEA